MTVSAYGLRMRESIIGFHACQGISGDKLLQIYCFFGFKNNWRFFHRLFCTESTKGRGVAFRSKKTKRNKEEEEEKEEEERICSLKLHRKFQVNLLNV